MKAFVVSGGLALCQILSNPSYQPPECINHVCVLTGLGGIVAQWEMHVDRNHGALFVVKGICASACYLAVARALKNGERVETMPGYELIPHEASVLRDP